MSQQRKQIGMKAVAQRAGVAVSSVSRVLGDHPNVSEAMRRRVLRAVTDLGYERDLLATSLRSGLSTTVGFLVSDISNPLFADIALGVEQRLREAGHAMLIANSHGSAVADIEQLRLLRQRRVDGLILSLSDETDETMIGRLKNLDRPYVLLDREVEGLRTSSVLSAHAQAIEDAVEYLVELGHRCVGLVGGAPSIRPTRERAEALRAACGRRRGVVAYVDCESYSADHGFAATQRMLDRTDPPTAIIAGGNQLLVGVLDALRARRYRIPQDVSLVTCDEVPLARFLDPPLATITRDTRQLGRQAADLLLAGLHGEPPSIVHLPVRFDPHRSCSVPSTRSPVHQVAARH